jgi:lysyl-tRNA synthetase class 1
MEHKRPSHWADQTAEKIIAEWGEQELYTCASGITPSGTVHVGNFREMISVELVVRALRDMG